MKVRSTDKVANPHDGHNRIGLYNPNPSGVLKAAALCLVDNDINLVFGEPFASSEQADEVRKSIQKTVSDYFGGAHSVPWRHGDNMMIVPLPVTADIDDLVAVVSQVKELEADWITASAQKWKIDPNHRPDLQSWTERTTSSGVRDDGIAH